jgi:hypothetical protein
MSEENAKKLFEIVKYLFLGIGALMILYLIVVSWLAANVHYNFADAFMIIIWSLMCVLFILALVCLAGTWKFYKRNKEDVFWAKRFFKLIEIIMLSGTVAYLFFVSLVLPILRNLK